MSGRAAGHTTKTDSCSQHTRASRRGGHGQRRARSSSVRSACPTASPNKAPYPGSTMLTVGSDDSFMPGQRRGIHLGRPRDRLPSAWRQAPAHPSTPAADQRQGRALHSHDARWMGLRAHLPLEHRTHCCAHRLARVLQSPPTTRRSRPPSARHPLTREQPPRVLQLAPGNRERVDDQQSFGFGHRGMRGVRSRRHGGQEHTVQSSIELYGYAHRSIAQNAEVVGHG